MLVKLRCMVADAPYQSLSTNHARLPKGQSGNGETGGTEMQRTSFASAIPNLRAVRTHRCLVSACVKDVGYPCGSIRRFARPNPVSGPPWLYELRRSDASPKRECAEKNEGCDCKTKCSIALSSRATCPAVKESVYPFREFTNSESVEEFVFISPRFRPGIEDPLFQLKIGFSE